MPTDCPIVIGSDCKSSVLRNVYTPGGASALSFPPLGALRIERAQPKFRSEHKLLEVGRDRERSRCLILIELHHFAGHLRRTVISPVRDVDAGQSRWTKIRMIGRAIER